MDQAGVDQLNAHMANVINAAVERGKREAASDLFSIDPDAPVGKCVLCGHTVTYADAEDGGSATRHAGCAEHAADEVQATRERGDDSHLYSEDGHWNGPVKGEGPYDR